MAKKKNNRTWYWVLGVLALLILIYGGSNGWFKSSTLTITNSTVLNQLNNPQYSTSCRISITPSIINAGENVFASLTDGKNENCVIYVNFNGQWSILNTITTDSNGYFSYSTPVNIAGDYTFRAICGDCITNAQTLKVIPTQQTSCTDTDGGDNKDVPGHVTSGSDVYYDYCLDSDPVYDLYEYYCIGNDWQGHKVSCDANQECFQTRSGGYCRLKETIPDWEVGDILYDSGWQGTEITGSGLTDTLDLSNLPPTSANGICKLQARIQTDWGYMTPETCQGLQGNEGLRFSFYDSSGKVWERTDTYPTGIGSLTKCGLEWDGQNLWSFEVNKILGLPDCIIGLDYKVEIVVCECD